MSSIAIAGSTAPAAPPAETDVVRRASRGDHAAFVVLYQEHHLASWRLASAVTGEVDHAGMAVADGLARVLRSVRRHRARAATAMRPLVLEAAYRSAIEAQRRRPTRGPVATVGSEAPSSAEELVAPVAFASLPERWRAALWLHAVEGYRADELAPVLGVSGPVAAQLVERAQRALAGRFAAAQVAMPTRVGPLLRPLTPTPPADLAAIAEGRWRHEVVGDAAGRYLPVAWLEERAARPLGMAATGLLALGVIGLGVVSQHTSVNGISPYLASGAPNPDGANGVTALGRAPGGSASSLSTGSDGLFSGLTTASQVDVTSAGFDYAGFNYDNGLVPVSGHAAPLATTGSTGVTGGGASPGGITGGGTTSGSGGGTAGATTGTTGGGSTATTPVTVTSVSPVTAVNLAPVASVTQTPSGGTTSVAVLPNPTTGAPTVGVNLGPCTSINLLGVVVGCTTTTTTTVPATPTSTPTTAAPAPTTTTTTTPSLLSPVTSLVSGLGL